MSFSIYIAEKERDLGELFAFRYAIYVEEMARFQKHADHISRIIRDPLDATGYNLIARDELNEMAGCVRVNFVRDGHLNYYVDLLNIRSVGEGYVDHAAVCTRFMLSKKHRKSQLAIALCRECFYLGKRNNIYWNFIDCNDHLVPFFSRLGYALLGRVNHEEYGVVNAMRFDVMDDRHMRDGSVFK